MPEEAMIGENLDKYQCLVVDDHHHHHVNVKNSDDDVGHCQHQEDLDVDDGIGSGIGVGIGGGSDNCAPSSLSSSSSSSTLPSLSMATSSDNLNDDANNNQNDNDDDELMIIQLDVDSEKILKLLNQKKKHQENAANSASANAASIAANAATIVGNEVAVVAVDDDKKKNADEEILTSITTTTTSGPGKIGAATAAIISADGTAAGAGGGGGHFFEGAEKRLAIYFKDSKSSAAANASLDLRKLTRSQWENVLDQVNCRILNKISNKIYDAYLLSESSLFVTKNSFLLKTCGSTTLLHCLELLLNYIFALGFDTVEDVFYSHKNLLLPSLQTKPHNSFLKETDYLDKYFSNGYSHLFGHINSDRWYLYMMEEDLKSNDINLIDNNNNNNNNNHKNDGKINDNYDDCFGVGIDDENLLSINNHNHNSLNNIIMMNRKENFKFEIIMEELDQNKMALFFNLDGKKSVKSVTKLSGIDSIIPGMIIDDYLFEPCGYSMNGLIEDYYMTIHITPEKEFSYVSIETNYPQKSYLNFMKKLIGLFLPKKFMFNLFVPNMNFLKKSTKICQTATNEKIIKFANDDNDDHDNDDDSNQDKQSSLEYLLKIHGIMIYETFSCLKINLDHQTTTTTASAAEDHLDDDGIINNNDDDVAENVLDSEMNKTAAGLKINNKNGKYQINQTTNAINNKNNNNYDDDRFNYRRCDFQMAQNEDLDIIYARYVNEGIS